MQKQIMNISGSSQVKNNFHKYYYRIDETNQFSFIYLFQIQCITFVSNNFTYEYVICLQNKIAQFISLGINSEIM